MQHSQLTGYGAEVVAKNWRHSWKAWLAAAFVLLMIVAACTGQDEQTAGAATPGATDAGAAASPAAIQPFAGAAPAGSAPAVSAAPAAAAPVTKLRTIHQRIPFTHRTVRDSALARGTTKIVTRGRSGYQDRVYRYTYRGWRVVKRTLLTVTVTRTPVAQVTHLGTKVGAPAPEPGGSCDPNYSGACVPIASDVDCAGGSGNGPAYVRGLVRVAGSDIYGLDRDRDGIGCE
jgi:hypothetical protein